MRDASRTSKRLSFWLRHRPDSADLSLDQGGWAPVPHVLAALGKAGLPDRMEDLETLVAASDKQRFELSADRSCIRARQGHSVEVELGWPVVEPPERLFHGTVDRFLPSILTEGLRAMRRHQVHLSPDPATARQVGARRGEPVILEVASGAMARSGFSFRLSGNGVWLADHVPASFLHVMEGA